MIQELKYRTIGDFIVNMEEVKYIYKQEEKGFDYIFIYFKDGEKQHTSVTKEESKRIFAPLVFLKEDTNTPKIELY